MLVSVRLCRSGFTRQLVRITPSEARDRGTGDLDFINGFADRLRVRLLYCYRFPNVDPGQSSVRNGEAGKPSLLFKFPSGLSAQS